jgi:hypothetical protein
VLFGDEDLLGNLSFVRYYVSRLAADTSSIKQPSLQGTPSPYLTLIGYQYYISKGIVNLRAAEKRRGFCAQLWSTGVHA